VCSVVCILDDPALELELACYSDHAVSEPDLPHLVVEEDGHVESEGRHGEVGEWNLSRTKGVVQEWHVAEAGDQSSLEEETEVSESVVHALLGKGQVSGLADHEISPLHAHDGDEVTGLSELEGLGGVANGPVSDLGVSIEAGAVTEEWPSA
jgi:hypothetical protein